MTQRNRMLMLACFGLACASFAGCGLNDYEKRMDEQRTRVRAFDELNKLLDDPIEIPTLVKTKGKDGSKEEGPAWSFDFILRLPKGYGTLPKVREKEKSNYFLDFPCFHYTGGVEGARNVLVAAALVADPKTPEEGKITPEKFRQYVRLAISDFHYRVNRVRVVVPDGGKFQKYEFPQFSAYPDLAPRLAFDWIDYRDTTNPQAKEHTAFDVYFHEDAGKQVAIVVHRPIRPVNLEAMNKAFETSLGTLDLSGDVAKRRAAFKRKR